MFFGLMFGSFQAMYKRTISKISITISQYPSIHPTDQPPTHSFQSYRRQVNSYVVPFCTPSDLLFLLYLEVSTTYRPAILPSCIRSYTFWSSLMPIDLYGALMSPRLKNSMASAESALFPTYDPLIVIILMTDSKIVHEDRLQLGDQLQRQ